MVREGMISPVVPPEARRFHCIPVSSLPGEHRSKRLIERLSEGRGAVDDVAGYS